MRHDRKDLDKTLRQHLLFFENDAVRELDSSRERIWERLKRRTPLPVSLVNDDPSRDAFRFSRQLTPARIAACLVAVLLATAVFYRAFVRPDDLYAIVETTGGSVVQISQGRTVAANAGDKIGVDTLVRTGSDAGAKLKLPDGSRIEMQQESELSWQRADDGLHIQLKQGSVNVTPAEEAVGKLYVQNREQLVPVMGAIFQSAAAPIQASIPAVAAPKWEVVSVRPCENTGGGGRGGGGGGVSVPQTRFDPERMILGCWNVWTLVATAYVEYANAEPNALAMSTANWTNKIEGLPAWWTETYTIEAKAEKAVDSAVMRGPMLRAILEDRFKLKIRREDREIPLLSLTVARGGAKLKPHEGNCVAAPMGGRSTFPADTVFCTRMGGVRPGTTGLGVTELEGETIPELIGATMMGTIAGTGKPIIDKTGITGRFDFKFESAFPPANIKLQAQRTGRPESDFPTSPTSLDVIENQFGLKLVETKGPYPHLVIDHVERPSPN